jgi:hypothetical protein
MTTLTWTSAPVVSATEVRVGSPTGPLFSAARNFTKATGKWVFDGTTFYLQDVSGGLNNTLATVTVPVTSAGCP